MTPPTGAQMPRRDHIGAHAVHDGGNVSIRIVMRLRGVALSKPTPSAVGREAADRTVRRQTPAAASTGKAPTHASAALGDGAAASPSRPGVRIIICAFLVAVRPVYPLFSRTTLSP